MVARDLVDDLSHTDDLALVVNDWHGEYAVRSVARLAVNFLVEPRIL